MKAFEKHSMSNPRLPFLFGTEHMHLPRSRLWGGNRNWHENIEIVYVESGSGFVAVNDNRIAVSAGDIISISANQIHSMSVSDHEMMYCYLIVDRSFFLSNFFDSNQFLFEAPIVDGEIEEWIKEFKKYWYTDSNTVPMRVQYLRSLALRICLALCDRHAVYSKLPREDTHVLACIKKAIGAISAECERKITLDEIASSVGLSKYYFAREFRRITGFSFVAYLNGLRCEKARKLLLLGELSIGEICAACGFENSSYFTRKFKEYSGYTPKDYRKLK